MDLTPIPIKVEAPTGDTLYEGDETFTVVAGKTLKIETSPNGEDILETECPVGKVWSVRVLVEITETNA
jgi:hypothetical protein